MNWQYVEITQAYLIHQVMVRRSGTRARLRDFGLLHSAIERPKASFGGEDLYPTVFDKAAALLQSLTMNHPVTDGNKRTAWAVTHRFLWINGQHLRSHVDEAVSFMLTVDREKMELGQIADWLREHCGARKGW